MTSHRRAALLPFLLVIAFMAHDGWMVVAHAGHIVNATPDGAPVMGEMTHAGSHRAAGSEAPQADVAVFAVTMPLPAMMMNCVTIRAGTLGQPTSTPGPSVSLAVLPIPGDVPDRSDVRGRLDWRPPGQAPAVRRAFLQVYRE